MKREGEENKTENIRVVEACRKALKQSFASKGRTILQEYWYYMLSSILLWSVVLGVSSIILVLNFINLLDGSATQHRTETVIAVVFVSLTVLFLLQLPSWVALTIRRLRDAGHSTKWALLLLAPGVGLVVLMILCSKTNRAEHEEVNSKTL